MSPPDPQCPSESPAATLRDRRLEAVLVILVILLGFGLRGLRPSAMAVEHFDEGVYASNLYSGHLDPPFAYPMRHLYAPPFFPALLEWAQIVAGPGAVMWVNVVLGSLTVLAVWWTTRCWFGRSAAIAAALLAATSEYHIAFSRMALTDVPLSLFMLLGVFAGWKGVLTGRPLWIAAGGTLAGVAWCTKYNGWLTLAITGTGTLAAYLVPKLLPGYARTARPLPGAGEGLNGGVRGNGRKIADCKLSLSAMALRWGATAAIAAAVFWWFVSHRSGDTRWWRRIMPATSSDPADGGRAFCARRRHTHGSWAGRHVQASVLPGSRAPRSSRGPKAVVFPVRTG
jgi:predicted membrane-bound mannosyltransferase